MHPPKPPTERLHFNDLETTIVEDADGSTTRMLSDRYAMAAAAVDSLQATTSLHTDEKANLIRLHAALLGAQGVLAHIWASMHGANLGTNEAPTAEAGNIELSELTGELNDIALLAVSMEHDQEADSLVTYLTQALPDPVPFQLGLVSALIHSNRIEWAQAIAHRAITEHPTHEHAQVAVGLVQRASGDERWRETMQHLARHAQNLGIRQLARNLSGGNAMGAILSSAVGSAARH